MSTTLHSPLWSPPTQFDSDIAMESGENQASVRVPAQTILFADTAWPALNTTGSGMSASTQCIPGKVQEYSFAEPNYYTNAQRFDPTFPPMGDNNPDPNYSLDTINLNMTNTPSIHFLHSGNANICWCDGHVSSEGPCYSRTISSMLLGRLTREHVVVSDRLDRSRRQFELHAPKEQRAGRGDSYSACNVNG